MFRKFGKGVETEYPVVLLDPHFTSPGQDEPAIIRNDLTAAKAESGRFYECARQIFDRAKRGAPRRTAGII